MATFAERVDALRADFAISGEQPIHEIVKVVSRATNVQVDGKPLAEQVRILFESVHGPVAEAGAATVAEPVAMGVPIDDVPPAIVEGQVVGATGGAAVATTTVSQAISDAIAIGAPTYNNGDATGCYLIYRRTAEDMVVRLGDDRERALLVAALQQAALEAEAGSARTAAWTMRRCFDALRGSHETLEAMPAAAEAVANSLGARGTHAAAAAAASASTRASASTSAASKTTLKHAIADAIDKGAPVYNRRNHAGCYYIYHRTAEEIVQRLDERMPCKRKLQGALVRARSLADPRGPSDPDGAAWTMRLCFDELMGGRDDPLLASGMPPAAAIKREAGFPTRSGQAQGAEASSCCVVA